VLLFDEFEKADSLFFDLLLQILGEARLTDAQGRLADFSNAAVILTSNLGAQDFQRGRAGLKDDRADRRAAARHFNDAVRAFVRPELYNRFDRVVPFQPLDQDVILAICKRELDQIRRRDGIGQRGVELETPDDAVAWLARAGYDVLYGARPLQRTMEKQLLAPLSTAINTFPPEHALIAEARVEEDRLNVRVRAKVDDAGRPVMAQASLSQEAALARRATDLRRNLQRLDRSAEMLEIVNELYRMEELLKTAAKRKARHMPAFDADRYREVKNAVEGLRDALERSIALEEDTLLQLYDMAKASPETAEGVSSLERGWRKLLLQIFALQFDQPHRVTLAVFGERHEFLFRLARAYLSLAREHRYQVSCCRYYVMRPDAEAGEKGGKPEHMLTRLERAGRKAEEEWRKKIGNRPLAREWLEDPGAVLAQGNVSAIGLGFEFSGHLSFIRFCTEAGLHVLVTRRKRHPCLVETSEERLLEYVPPEGMERKGWLPPQHTRRTYEPPLDILEDPLLGEASRSFRGSLHEAMERYLQQCAERLLT
jgi:hypothetical protein